MNLLKKLVTIGMCAFLLAGCGSSSGDTVVIASKTFTENILLSEIYAQLIENKTDLKVERKQNLGGTSIIFPAMEQGEVDIYVEYSGTIKNEILNNQDIMSSEEIFNFAKTSLKEKYKMTFFDPIGINNTFALGMSKETANRLNVKSMSDLAAVSSDLKFGANHIFFTRELDGYDAMIKEYGYNFKEDLKMDTSLLYDAIKQNQLDVIIVYATDALLIANDMIVLEDDKDFFPAYHGAPVIRDEVLEKHPELNEVLNLLAGKLTDQKMQELNHEIDLNNRSIGEVATEFLNELGLLD